MHSLPSPSALQMIGVSKKMVDAKNFFSSFQLLFLDDGEYRRRRILTWVCVYSSYILSMGFQGRYLYVLNLI